MFTNSTGFGESGQAVWDDLYPNHEGHPDELLQLRNLADLVDMLDTLDGVIADQGPTVTGQQNTKLLNQAIPERRQTVAAVQTALKSLGYGSAGAETRSESARRAARTRWDRG